jgi:hypothetical protein
VAIKLKNENHGELYEFNYVKDINVVTAVGELGSHKISISYKALLLVVNHIFDVY